MYTRYTCKHTTYTPNTPLNTPRKRPYFQVNKNDWLKSPFNEIDSDSLSREVETWWGKAGELETHFEEKKFDHPLKVAQFLNSALTQVRNNLFTPTNTL